MTAYVCRYHRDGRGWDACSDDRECDSPPVRCSQCGNDMNVEPHAERCPAAAYIAAMAGRP